MKEYTYKGVPLSMVIDSDIKKLMRERKYLLEDHERALICEAKKRNEIVRIVLKQIGMVT